MITKVSIDGFPKEIVLQFEKPPADWSQIKQELAIHGARLRQIPETNYQRLGSAPPSSEPPTGIFDMKCDLPYLDPELLAKYESTAAPNQAESMDWERTDNAIKFIE
jgi:hypothetical protein